MQCVCRHTHACRSVCFVHRAWSFHSLSATYNDHMIAQNSSQMLKSCSPIVSKMHICDKSADLSASWPHEHLFPSHVFFLALTDRIDWLCQSYCDRFALGEVPDCIAINHGSEHSDIHTCSTAGSLVAQFLVPFPVNRRRFHIASWVWVSTVAYRWGLKL